MLSIQTMEIVRNSKKLKSDSAVAEKIEQVK